MEYFTDEQIIKGCLQKDGECMEVLYKRYVSKLYNCALRYTRKVEDAEDVLQDSLIQIFENIGQYNGKGSLLSWMTTIVINRALMLYRENIKRMNHDDFSVHQEQIEDVAVVQSDAYTHQLLLGFVQELADGYRVIFNMREIEGFSYEEIATRLNISATTCRTQLFRAKKILQSKIENYNKKQKYYNKIN